MEARREILETPLADHGGRLASPTLSRSKTSVRRDFSVCLNAYGPAPIVRDAVRNAAIDEYPDRFSRAPRQAAAYRWERPVEEIVFGAGAAELIQAVCFAYLTRNDCVVVAAPCFGEYERAARLCGAHVESVVAALHLDEAAQWDNTLELVSVVLRTRPRLVFLASPSSPSGVQYSIPMLRKLADACARCDCLLILDQSYDAFSTTLLGTPALSGHDHVVHIRSLTKDHALAGVRAAFAVAAPAVASCIERARVPWASSTAAQAAAVAAMSNEAIEHVRQTTERLRNEARQIVSFCETIGLTVEASSTHYMLIRCCSGNDAREMLLADHGVLVRDCTSFGLPSHIRVAARVPADNAALMEALRSLGRVNTARTSEANQ